MPAVAARASWIETFGLPLREIKARYTKSEIVICGWRSSEMAYRMRQTREGTSERNGKNVTPINRGSKVRDYIDRQRNKLANEETSESGAFESQFDVPQFATNDRTIQALEERLGPVAYKLDESLDLRKLTGPEAYRFMKAQGLNIPVFNIPRQPKKEA